MTLLRSLTADLVFWAVIAYVTAASQMPVFGQIPYNAVGKVHAPLTGMEASGGSCTLIAKSGDKGIAITAYHVIQGSTGKITVDFRNSATKYAARVIKVDPDYDIAALLIAAPPEVEPPKGIKIPTAEDGPFTRVGYPWYAHGQQHHSIGNLMPDKMTGVSAWAPSMAHTTGTSPSGFSGGGMFTKDGYYCGVVSGNTSDSIQSPPDRTWGCSGDVLVQFCQSCCDGYCPVYVSPQPSRRVVITPTQPRPQPQPQPASYTDPQWVKWREDNDKRITDLQVSIESAKCKCGDQDYASNDDLKALAVEVTNLSKSVSTITENLAVINKTNIEINHKLADLPTDEQLTDAVVARLQPIAIRVQDARGADYSTEYQEIRVGTKKQYVTLPFGPRN